MGLMGPYKVTGHWIEMCRVKNEHWLQVSFSGLHLHSNLFKCKNKVLVFFYVAFSLNYPTA